MEKYNLGVTACFREEVNLVSWYSHRREIVKMRGVLLSMERDIINGMIRDEYCTCATVMRFGRGGGRGNRLPLILHNVM